MLRFLRSPFLRGRRIELGPSREIAKHGHMSPTQRASKDLSHLKPARDESHPPIALRGTFPEGHLEHLRHPKTEPYLTGPLRGPHPCRRRDRHPGFRENFAQRTSRAFVLGHDRACSLRQHRTWHSLVRQAGGVVALARGLLRADAEAVRPLEPAGGLPVDHAGATATGHSWLTRFATC
jgi:hypothetical protein